MATKKTRTSPNPTTHQHPVKVALIRGRDQVHVEAAPDADPVAITQLALEALDRLAAGPSTGGYL